MASSTEDDNRKKVLFFPLNSPGHINSSLGIADKLKQEFNYRNIFLILGKMIDNTIVEHGHELMFIEDDDNPYEDYEISSDDDLTKPLDEEKKIKLGRKKKIFSGCHKWPQLLIRHLYLFQLPPLESFIKSTKIFEANMTKDVIKTDDLLRGILEELKPDLVVIDAYYIPPAIVTYKHCPWVRLYSANPLAIYEASDDLKVKIAPMNGFELLTKEKRDYLRNNKPDEWEKMFNEWKNASDEIMISLNDAGKELNDYVVSRGCEPIPKGKQSHDSPYINLYMFPKELDYDQDDDLFKCPSRYFRCDSLLRMNYNIDDDCNPTIQKWLNKFEQAKKGKEKSIFFSLGTIASGNHRIMRDYVNVFKEDQKNLYIVSKGVNGNKYTLDSNNMIGDNFIPQTMFLKKVDLAIIHGGNNSLTECFYYGVPMIVLPVFADQLDNAQRVVDLGLGKKLNTFNLDKDTLLKTIDNVLADEEMTKRCKAIGEKMRARDDSIKASLILKKLVDDGQLEQSFIDDCRDKNVDEIQW